MALRILLICWGLLPTASVELAVVRPFAIQDEIEQIRYSSFNSWDNFPPCGAGTKSSVDLFLVYSRTLDKWAAASATVEEVIASFHRREQHWHRCFRSIMALGVNLSAAEDVYDARGQETNPNWVSGPNAVFRFLLRKFLKSHYHAFFLMEMDARPARPLWLEQFEEEAVQWPQAAIRGSRYKGDKWDNYLGKLPDDMRMHINGNAIYYTQHPFLSWLSGQLHREAATEKNAIPYDVRMAQLTLAAERGSMPECGRAWRDLVPAGQRVYASDSRLIGNYANTLLNTTFDGGEFVAHGSRRNIFSEVNQSQVTLAVFHLSDSSFESLHSTISTIHPFREVLVLQQGATTRPPDLEVRTPRGPTRVSWLMSPQSGHQTFCDVAEHIATELFAITDSSHLIASPVSILADGDRPVLPFLTRASVFCASRRSCRRSTAQASERFNVSLHSHFETADTLFKTRLARAFCRAFKGSAPTADDYVAYLLRERGSLERDYVAVDRGQTGWRSWTVLNRLTVLGSRRLSEVGGNTSNATTNGTCSQYIEQQVGCDADPACMWMAHFSSGNCVPYFHETTMVTTMVATTVVTTMAANPGMAMTSHSPTIVAGTSTTTVQDPDAAPVATSMGAGLSTTVPMMSPATTMGQTANTTTMAVAVTPMVTTTVAATTTSTRRAMVVLPSTVATIGTVTFPLNGTAVAVMVSSTSGFAEVFTKLTASVNAMVRKLAVGHSDMVYTKVRLRVRQSSSCVFPRALARQDDFLTRSALAKLLCGSKVFLAQQTCSVSLESGRGLREEDTFDVTFVASLRALQSNELPFQVDMSLSGPDDLLDTTPIASAAFLARLRSELSAVGNEGTLLPTGVATPSVTGETVIQILAEENAAVDYQALQTNTTKLASLALAIENGAGRNVLGDTPSIDFCLERNCSGRGTCQNGVCVCPGWSAPNCQFPVTTTTTRDVKQGEEDDDDDEVSTVAIIVIATLSGLTCLVICVLCICVLKHKPPRQFVKETFVTDEEVEEPGSSFL